MNNEFNQENEQNNENIGSRVAKSKENKKKKKKLIIFIVIFILLSGVLFVGGEYLLKHNNKPQSNTNPTPTTNDGGEIIKDYKFDDKGNAVPVKAPNIGMAIKSAIQGDTSGHAKMAIKNSGDIDIAPQVMFNGKAIYQAPTLKPGEAVEADLKFGELSVGEHEFNVLAMYQGGSGLSLKSKVVIQ